MASSPKPKPLRGPASPELAPPPNPHDFVDEWKRFGPVLFSFDFDGTLVPIESRPEEVSVAPALLGKIQSITRQIPILICTGRAYEDVVHFFPDCPKIDFIANHGLELYAHTGEIRDFTPPEWYSFRERLMDPLDEQIRAHGGMIEDKERSLTLHFRNSGEDYWTGLGIEWLRKQLPVFVQALPGKKSWNIMPATISKGTALVEYAAERGYQTVLFFGDEPTDETIFSLSEDLTLGFQIVGVKVGTGPTRARYRVEGPEDVLAWIDQLSMFESGLM